MKRMLVFLIAIIMTFPSPAPAAEKPSTPERALIALGSEDGATLKEARNFLIRNSQLAWPVLHNAVLDRKLPPLTRLRAVELLGENGTADSVAALSKALIPPEGKAEENARVREEIIRSLARLKATKNFPTISLIEQYYSSGKEDSVRVKVAIADTLALGRDERSLRILTDLMKDADPDVRSSAMLSLYEINNVRLREKGQTRTAAKLSGDSFVGGHFAVADSQPRVDPADDAAIKTLKERINDESPRVRKSAEEILEQYRRLYAREPH